MPRAHSSWFFRRPVLTAESDLKRSQLSAYNLAFMDASRFVSWPIVPNSRREVVFCFVGFFFLQEAAFEKKRRK